MESNVRVLKKLLKDKGLFMGLEKLSPEEEFVIQQNLLQRIKRVFK